MLRVTLTHRHRRRGFTLLELTTACAMFVVVALVVAELVHGITRQERSADARQAALRAVANRLEQLQARDWDDLPVAKTDETLPDDVQMLLKTARMQTEVTTVEEGAARQIRVQIDWRDPAGNWLPPVALSAWKHRPRSEEQR
jgi:type II secretory pathway pseudopilin PulG